MAAFDLHKDMQDDGDLLDTLERIARRAPLASADGYVPSSLPRRR